MPVLADYFQRHWIRLAGSLLILGFFTIHVTKWHQWDFIDRLEASAYDARLVLTMPGDVDDRLVIVDIDEKSLTAEGRWPWSRDKVALLLDRLFDDYGVSLVAFDVVFAESEEVSGLRVVDNLAREFGDDPQFLRRAEQIRSDLDHDARLAQSIDQSGRRVVLGYFFTEANADSPPPRIGKLPEPVFLPGQFSGRKIGFLRADGFGANLAIFQDRASLAGHIVSTPDVDGVVRRVPMLYQFDGAYYESMSLAVARLILGADQIEPGFPPQSKIGRGYSGMEWLSLSGPDPSVARIIPVDNDVQTLVPFRGRQGSFPYVSATDVVNGRATRERLEGRVALVGTTAKGLFDLRSTPVQPNFPGVEVHANLIAGIVDDRILQNPAYMLGAEVIFLVVSGLVMTFVLPLLRPLAAAGGTALLLLAIVGINVAIWKWASFVFPLAAGLLTVLVMFLFNMTYGYIFEQRDKRQLAGLFGQYVPPELVEEMSGNPDEISMESESRELTVLFSDVRGFTTISEGLDPRALSDLMNGFLTPMTEIIHANRGTIDKYMGDAIMAFWGAPMRDSNHARRALDAAMQMLDALDSLQPDFAARGWPPIAMGVGLNTGSMSVGNMGSEFRVAYTVLGDAVNLGSRLEGLTKQYGVRIIVSETTAAAVPEYAYRELDRVRVKGKDKPVTIYEPIGVAQALDKQALGEIEVYREGLRHYRNQQWDLAELQFLNLQQAAPQRELYRIYQERIALYRQTPPPPGWDGVFTFVTK